VYELCTREGSAKEVAQKLGVDRVNLYNWKSQLIGREASASMNQDKRALAESDRDKLKRQVETLKRDIHNLQIEQIFSRRPMNF
jgi:transposase-like protein